MNLSVDWNATYWNSPPLWRMAVALGVMLIGIMMYLLISNVLPGYISNVIRRFDRRSRKRAGGKTPPSESAEFSKQLLSFERNVRRFIGWMIMLVFAIIIVKVLGSDIYTRFRFYGYDFSLLMVVTFLIILTLGKKKCNSSI